MGIFTSNTFANLTYHQYHPFIGADFQKRTLNFENDFGKNLFREHAFQYDLYAGIRFCNYWGLDIGYFANKNKNRTIEYGPGETVLGQTLNTTDPTETHYTETKIKGPHVDFLIFCPLLSPIEAIAGIGLSYSKLMLKDAIVEADHVFIDTPVSRIYDIKKLNARALLGLQTLTYGCIALRATITFENTGVFNNLKPAALSSDIRSVNVKNSWIIGLGTFVIV